MWSYAWTPIIFIVSYFSCTHHEKPRTLLGQKQKGRELLVVPKLNQKSRNLACREWGYYHYCYYFDEFTRHTLVHKRKQTTRPPPSQQLLFCLSRPKVAGVSETIRGEFGFSEFRRGSQTDTPSSGESARGREYLHNSNANNRQTACVTVCAHVFFNNNNNGDKRTEKRTR